MAYPVLTFEAEMQPYINQLGDSSLPQANRAGKGYAKFTPTMPTKFTDTPVDGTSMQLDARHAFVTVKGGGIRVRTDATAPSATSGWYIPAGSVLVFKNQAQMLQNWQMVDNQGETSEVSANFFA